MSEIVMKGSVPLQQYTWNPYWISQYESSWGIFEKFKYANCADIQDIFAAFGGHEIQKLLPKRIFPSKRSCDLKLLQQFDDEKIKGIFEMDVKASIQADQHTISGVFGEKDMMREFVHYCKKCLYSPHMYKIGRAHV
jgi:hypothetical protein